MVTYLLSAGYSPMQVGIARTLSVVFEILATWFAPWLMGRIGAIRAGLWLSTCQVITLAAGFTVFWVFEDKSLLSATGLVVGTILSRLGLSGFDLCIQLIVQEVRLQPPLPLFSDAQGLLRMSRPRAAVRFPLLRLLGKMP
jgi:iron-regulated transporter 1